jgi:hypothetical protein
MPRRRLEGAQGIEGGEFVEPADHRLAMPGRATGGKTGPQCGRQDKTFGSAAWSIFRRSGCRFGVENATSAANLEHEAIQFDRAML